VFEFLQRLLKFVVVEFVFALEFEHLSVLVDRFVLDLFALVFQHAAAVKHFDVAAVEDQQVVVLVDCVVALNVQSEGVQFLEAGWVDDVQHFVGTQGKHPVRQRSVDALHYHFVVEVVELVFHYSSLQIQHF